MRNWALLMLLVAANELTASALPRFPIASPAPLARGLIIHYPAKTSPAALDKLHRSLGLKVQKRLVHWNADWLIPASGAKTFSVGQVRRLCERYRRTPLVEGCEGNYPLRLYGPAANGGHDAGATKNRPVEAKAKVCPDLLSEEEAGQAPLREGTLTALWAQFQIGADLTPQLLKQVPNAKPVNTGIYDSGFSRENLLGNLDPALSKQMEKNPEDFADPNPGDGSGAVHVDTVGVSHGDQVANLVNSARSPLGVGVGHLTQLTQTIATLHQTDADKIPLTGVKLANVSLGWRDMGANQPNAKLSVHQSFAHKVFSKMRDNGTIVVFAAGNDYPQPVDSIPKYGILVGSSDPDGMASDFSQEDPHVAVLAPSDSALTSLGQKGKTSTFGGTSGAAPLVTGALDVAVSLLPGLTQAEAITLLKQSSTKGYNARQTPAVNGAGILNQHRLHRAVLALAAHWPANRDDLANPRHYDFAKEARTKYEQARKALDQARCETDEPKKAFRLLRESFFLNPDDADVRRDLARIYRALGRPANAEFFENIGLDDESYVASLEEARSQIGERAGIDVTVQDQFDQRFKRGMRNLRGPQAVTLLSKMTQDFVHQSAALKKLAQLGQLDVLRPFIDSKNANERSAAASALQYFHPTPPTPILVQLAKDSDPQVSHSALIAAAKGGAGAGAVFEAFADAHVQGFEGDKSTEAFQALRLAAAGSKFLGGAQTPFVAKLFQKSPKYFDAAIDELKGSPNLEPAALLELALDSADPETAKRHLAAWTKYAEEDSENLDADQLQAMVKSVDARYGASAHQTEMANLLAALGPAGRTSLEQKFNRFTDAKTRLMILSALATAPGDRVQTAALYERALKENLADEAIVARAVRFLAPSQPDKVLALSKHPSAKVKDAILDSIPLDAPQTATEEYRELIQTGLQSADPQLTPTAAYFASRSTNAALNEVGWKQFPKMKTEHRRTFLYNALANPRLTREALERGLGDPETAEKAVSGSMLHPENKQVLEEEILRITGTAEKPGTLRNVYFDTFFTSRRSQKSLPELRSERVSLAIAEEWERRGFPPVDESFMKIFTRRAHPKLNAIGQKAPKSALLPEED